jgi:TonB family protein
MKNILLFVFIVINIGCNYNGSMSYNGYAQQKDYSSKFEALLRPSEKQLSSSYNMMKSYDSQSEKYIKRVFIPEDKTLISYIEYIDAGYAIIDGIKRTYYPNGNLNKETPYINNEPYGIGFEFHKHSLNAIKSKGKYEGGKRHGEWENFNEEGRSTALYIYIEGDRHGPYSIYGENGEIKEEGMYIRGKLKKRSNKSQAETVDNKKVFKVVEQMPQFPGCENEQDSLERHKCQQMEMLKFVYGNLKYPAIDREMGMQGLNVVQFVVDKSGVVKDVESVRVVTRAMEKATIDVINKMPKWHPGIQNDEPVHVLFTLPVKFKLE